GVARTRRTSDRGRAARIACRRGRLGTRPGHRRSVRSTQAECRSLSRSPVTDSNRRPPPYHALRSVAVGCRRLPIGLFARFRARPVCCRLPAVAPAGLYKCSICKRESLTVAIETLLANDPVRIAALFPDPEERRNSCGVRGDLLQGERDLRLRIFGAAEAVTAR